MKKNNNIQTLSEEIQYVQMEEFVNDFDNSMKKRLSKNLKRLLKIILPIILVMGGGLIFRGTMSFVIVSVVSEY